MLKYLNKFKNKIKRYLWIGQILILLSFNMYSVYGGETNKISTINIVTPEWKGATNKDETGLYIELLHKIYDPVGIKVKYEFVPWMRAVNYIDTKAADAMLGSYKTVDAFFPNYPLDTEYTAVVHKKDTVDKWNGEKTIEDKSVVWVRGYNYHKYLNVDVDYLEVSKSDQGWKMLMADRTDYFMDSLDLINRYANENNINLANFQIRTVLIKNLYVRFARTQKSKKLIRIYDNRMKELIKSGEIKKLFTKWDSMYPDFTLVKK